MADPRYTIAVSNYNMADTLTASLTSVLEQLDDRFELIVVDDGSTDGSVEQLQRLENEYDLLEVVTDAGNDNLGEARNHSFELANGDYVLSAIDTDDQFTRCIPEFVSLYHQLEDGRADDFLLLAGGLYMAPRDLLLEVPYRSLGYGEDRDFYRRLIASDALLSISHVPFRHSIGYDRSFSEKFRVGFETIVVQFQSGISFGSYQRWAIWELLNDGGQLDRHRALAHVVLSPFAYMRSLTEDRYEAPPEFRDIAEYKKALRGIHMTASQLEQHLGIDIDWSDIGPRGRALFDKEDVDDIID
ncbi:glycosyltransferase family 2 protein [Halorhabdus rudnickae]|uniref:glycosyltransferase family 2 protein n=1 Tax=Halorhabdus rudnickae TaxID=1775544 RepID=UPI0024530780|nr:glycosyltransferase family 2 protein [Halorhabdus rudnickae]